MVLLLIAVGAPGCFAPEGAPSGTFAAVVIEGRTQEQIREAAFAVFEGQGYEGSTFGLFQMKFERAASAGKAAAHGSLDGQAAVGERVKAAIVPLQGGLHRLECTAYVVRDYGDKRFEEEIRLTNMRRAPYQTLLEEVRQRVGGAPKGQ